MSTEDSTRPADAKPAGFFGRVFGNGGKQYKRAKLGQEMKMYYNEELKAWVEPGEEDSKRKELAALNAPPPTATSSGAATAPMANPQPPNIGAPKPIAFGSMTMQRTTVTARYAAMPNLSTSNPGGSATSSSLLGGLGGGTFAGAQQFKPAAVFKPAAAMQEAQDVVQQEDERSEREGHQTLPLTATMTMQHDGGYEVPTNEDAVQQQSYHDDGVEVAPGVTGMHVAGLSRQSSAGASQQQQQEQSTPRHPLDDPAVMEVLSFWAFYRQCGYEPDAMAEWVQQNYGDEFAQTDYETLLRDEDIKAAVAQHLDAHRRRPGMESPASHEQGSPLPRSPPPIATGDDGRFVENGPRIEEGDFSEAVSYRGQGGSRESNAEPDHHPQTWTGFEEQEQQQQQQQHDGTPHVESDIFDASGVVGYDEAQHHPAVQQELQDDDGVGAHHYENAYPPELTAQDYQYHQESTSSYQQYEYYQHQEYNHIGGGGQQEGVAEEQYQYDHHHPQYHMLEGHVPDQQHHEQPYVGNPILYEEEGGGEEYVGNYPMDAQHRLEEQHNEHAEQRPPHDIPGHDDDNRGAKLPLDASLLMGGDNVPSAAFVSMADAGALAHPPTASALLGADAASVATLSSRSSEDDSDVRDRMVAAGQLYLSAAEHPYSSTHHGGREPYVEANETATATATTAAAAVVVKQEEEEETGWGDFDVPLPASSSQHPENAGDPRLQHRSHFPSQAPDEEDQSGVMVGSAADDIVEDTGHVTAEGMDEHVPLSISMGMQAADAAAANALPTTAAAEGAGAANGAQHHVGAPGWGDSDVPGDGGEALEAQPIVPETHQHLHPRLKVTAAAEEGEEPSWPCSLPSETTTGAAEEVQRHPHQAPPPSAQPRALDPTLTPTINYVAAGHSRGDDDAFPVMEPQQYSGSALMRRFATPAESSRVTEERYSQQHVMQSDAQDTEGHRAVESPLRQHMLEPVGLQRGDDGSVGGERGSSEPRPQGGIGIATEQELSSGVPTQAPRALAHTAGSVDADAAAQLEAMREDVVALRAQLRETQEALVAASSERGEAFDRAEEAESALQALHVEIESLRHTCDELKERVQQQQSECERLNSALSGKDGALAEVEARWASLQQERDAVKGQLEELKVEKDAVMADAEAKLALLQEERDGLEVQVQALQGDKDARVAEAEARCAGLQQECDGLQEQVQALRMEKDAVLADAEARSAMLQEDRDGLEVQLQALTAEKDASIADARAKYETVREERDALRVQLTEFQTSVVADGGELQHAKEEVQRLQAALEEAQGERDDLKEVLELKDEAIADLKTKAEENAKLAALLQEARAREEETRRTFEARIAQLESDAVERDSDATKQARERCVQLTARVEEMQRELETAVLGLDEKDAEIMQLEARAVNAEGALASAEAAAAQRAEDAASASSRAKEAERRFALAKKKILAQQAQHETLNAEVESLKARLQEAQDSGGGTQASEAMREELEEMALALDLAQRSQTALNQEVESLRARLEEAMSTRAADVESLSEDNARVAQMLVEYEAKEAGLNAENASLHARLRDVEHLSHALSTAREQATQWQSAAEQFDLRCTALEEQLAQERAQREAAASSAAAMQNELAVLQTSLQNTEAQLAELEAVQDAVAAQESRTEELERKLIATEAELEASRRSALLERNKSQESSQTGQGQSLPAGMDADDVAELMDELSALRSQLSASSEVASGKEEELRKYKLQLVKAKKLRALDAEKLAAAEAALKAATAQVQEQQHLAEPPNGTSPALEEDIALLKDRLAAAETEMAGMSALREELESLRETVGETEAGMHEALSALGVEEAKVARLAEMLNEHGVADDVLEAELDAVEELMMEMSGDGGGGSEEEESIL